MSRVLYHTGDLDCMWLAAEVKRIYEQEGHTVDQRSNGDLIQLQIHDGILIERPEVTVELLQTKNGVLVESERLFTGIAVRRIRGRRLTLSRPLMKSFVNASLMSKWTS